MSIAPFIAHERSVVTFQSAVRLAERVQEADGGRAASTLNELLAGREVSEEEAWAELAIFRDVSFLLYALVGCASGTNGGTGVPGSDSGVALIRR